MDNITYCKSWFIYKKRPIQIWDEVKARKAHEARQKYTAILGDTNHPECFIDIINDFIGVSFFDDDLRVFLDYHFKEIEPGKLFLKMATYRTFEDDSDEVLSGEIYLFRQDGSIDIIREKFTPHSLEKAKTTKDVSGNYEDYPGFGDYSGVATLERPLLQN